MMSNKYRITIDIVDRILAENIFVLLDQMAAEELEASNDWNPRPLSVVIHPLEEVLDDENCDSG